MSQERTGRSGGAPIAQIILVALAVILGFVVLRSLGGDDGGGDGDASDATTTEATSDDTTTSPPTTQVDMAKATVVVANGAGVSGLAARTTEYLKASGVPNVLDPVDADNRYASSAVYYSTGLQDQAEEVGQILGISAVQPFPTTLPLADPAQLGGANVLVLLGQDYAAGPPTTTAGVSATTAPAAAVTTPST